MTPGGGRAGRLALTMTVLINGYGATLQVLIHSGRISEWPHLTYTSFPLLFLTAPLIIFYVRTVIGHTPVWEKNDNLMLVPAAVALLWCLPIYVMSANEKLEFLYSPENRLLHIAPLLVLCCVNFIYILQISTLIAQFHLKIQRVFSELSHLKLRWLTLILNVGILIWMARLGWAAIIQMGLGFDSHLGVQFVTPTIVAIGFMMLTIGAIRQSSFFELLERQGLKAADVAEGLNIPPLNEPDPQLLRLLEKARSLTTKNQLYLDPELSLPSLARHLNAPIYLVSKALNRQGGLTFYDFINDFRVEAAKANLQDLSSSHKSILAIAEDSGFKSKSVFNEIFKKRTGMTPSDFRRQAPISSETAN